MARPFLRTGLAALSASIATACGEGTPAGPDPSDLPSVASVRGIVRTDLDELLPNVAVRLVPLRVGGDSCATPADVAGEAVEVRTDGYGRFSATVAASPGDVPSCVAVAALPPPESGLTSAWDTVAVAFVPLGQVAPSADIMLTLHGERFVEVAAGEAHACALRSDGALECWGENGAGQAPARRKAGEERFEQVSAAASRSCAVRSDVTIECWGEVPVGMRRIKTPTRTSSGPFVGVRVGAYACALQEALQSNGITVGGAHCWWSEPRDPSVTPPVLTAGDTAASYIEVRLTDVTMLSATQGACALGVDGVVRCWAAGGPAQRVAEAGSYVGLDAGADHVCAIRDDGVVECWTDGATGAAVPPTRTASTGAFARVSAGTDYTCALRDDGAVECWGLNDAGQAPPLVTATNGSFTQVSAGGRHTCALRDDGAIECWGLNDRGQAPPVRRVGEGPAA